jgi:hypothetical protein
LLVERKATLERLLLDGIADGSVSRPRLRLSNRKDEEAYKRLASQIIALGPRMEFAALTEKGAMRILEKSTKRMMVADMLKLLLDYKSLFASMCTITAPNFGDVWTKLQTKLIQLRSEVDEISAEVSGGADTAVDELVEQEILLKIEIRKLASDHSSLGLRLGFDADVAKALRVWKSFSKIWASILHCEDVSGGRLQDLVGMFQEKYDSSGYEPIWHLMYFHWLRFHAQSHADLFRREFGKTVSIATLTTQSSEHYGKLGKERSKYLMAFTRDNLSPRRRTACEVLMDEMNWRRHYFVHTTPSHWDQALFSLLETWPPV